MMEKKKTSLLILIFTTILAYGQHGIPKITLADTANIVFKDTVFNIAFDSIFHNLGNIIPTYEHNRLVKHFKYIGTKPILITKVWTSDPHFICDFPNEPLVPNKIYSFTVCFCHQGRQGNMTKVMGFELSDGNRISFQFTGKYIPLEKGE